MPAVLVEAGIILNRRDELILEKASTRERLATAIAEGLRRCLNRGAPSRGVNFGDRPFAYSLPDGYRPFSD